MTEEDEDAILLAEAQKRLLQKVEYKSHEEIMRKFGLSEKDLNDIDTETQMTKVYCYDRCTTCQKALKWLEANDVQFEKIDIKSNHPDEMALRELHKRSGLPLKKFFNTSGMLYRDLKLSEKLPSMSEDEQFKLLASDGMLVKRPLLVTDSAVLVGFKEPEWHNALAT